MNSELPARNGQRLKLSHAESAPTPSVRQVDEQQALAALSGSEAVNLLIKSSTAPAKLLKVLSKALGPAEAEIEFVEKIRIKG